MQKALFTLLASAAVGAPLFAQATLDPCGPAVWHIDPVTGAKTNVPGDYPELNNLAFNVTGVAQLCLIPNPGTGPQYIGSATVQKIGATDFDVITFDYTPGSNPVVTTYADTLNGTGDEFQASTSFNGLALCCDTGAGNPIGNGTAIVATRTALGTAFGNAVVISGVPGGYIDPCLGRIANRNVLFYADSTGPIFVGDIDLNPTSPNYGVVTSIRTAVPSQVAVPGFRFNHSPSSAYDNNGDTVGLQHSVYSSPGGSDCWYQSAPDLSQFNTAPSIHGMKSYPLFEDGTAWNNNPAVLKGTSIYAHSGTYTDVRRIEAVTLSSCYLSAIGGSVRNTLQTPMSTWNDTVISAVNYGFVLLPTPIDPNIIPGLSGYGRMCLATAVAISTGPMVGGEAVSSFPFVGSVPVGAVMLAEGVLLNLTTLEVYLSNVGYVEFR